MKNLDIVKNYFKKQGFTVSHRTKKEKLYLTLAREDMKWDDWKWVKGKIAHAFPDVYITSGSNSNRTYRLNNPLGPGR